MSDFHGFSIMLWFMQAAILHFFPLQAAKRYGLNIKNFYNVVLL